MKTVEKHLQDLFVGKQIKVIGYDTYKEYTGVCESCEFWHSDDENCIVKLRIKGIDKDVFTGLDNSYSGIEILND